MLPATRNRSETCGKVFQLDDRSPGRDQDQVGGPSRGHGAIVRPAGAVDDGKLGPGTTGSLEGRGQSAGLGGDHGRIILASPVFPFCGRRLRIEIDHRDGMTGLSRSHGDAEGEGGLSNAALLSD